MLYLSLKKMLMTTNLNKPSLKGINNTSLFLLVVAYLKNLNYKKDPLVMKKDLNSLELGKLFSSLLYFYGNIFDYNCRLIDCSLFQEDKEVFR